MAARTENCADSRGRRGCKGVAGNGLGEEAAGDERAWLRGRLWTANGWGELRGRLRTAWVQGGNGRGEEAAGDQRAWLRGRLQTAWVQGLRLLKSFRMPFLANIFFTFFLMIFL